VKVQSPFPFPVTTTLHTRFLNQKQQCVETSQLSLTFFRAGIKYAKYTVSQRISPTYLFTVTSTGLHVMCICCLVVA